MISLILKVICRLYGKGAEKRRAQRRAEQAAAKEREAEQQRTEELHRQKKIAEQQAREAEAAERHRVQELALRPVNSAIHNTFKFLRRLSNEQAEALQIAVMRSDYYSSLPRDTRPLSTDLRKAITVTAFETLPSDAFLELHSIGVKPFKQHLDAKHLYPEDDPRHRRSRAFLRRASKEPKEPKEPSPIEYHPNDWIENHDEPDKLTAFEQEEERYHGTVDPKNPDRDNA